MNRKLKAKIQREIRKRAFKRSDRLRQHEQISVDSQHTLEALKEVTGLPRPELRAIARDVRLSFEVRKDEFFSIRNQILISIAISGFVIILGWLLLMI
jgi:hypothetical protein